SSLSRSTSLVNAAIALSTDAGVSSSRRASSRWVRYPSPSHWSTASPTRARQASTAFPTVTVKSARKSPNSSPPPPGAGFAPPSPGAPAAGRRLRAAASRRARRGAAPEAEDLFRRLRVEGGVVHGLERDEPVEGAHQLAHVPGFGLGHGLEDSRRETRAPLFRLAAQDGDARLIVGQADIDHEATRQARDQALVQVGDLGRRAVARQDDLVARDLERLGQVQQLGLHFLSVTEELDVVHEE